MGFTKLHRVVKFYKFQPNPSSCRLMTPIRELLKHSNVDVRIEAGELIAHIFELGRDYDEDFDEEVKHKEISWEIV